MLPLGARIYLITQVAMGIKDVQLLSIVPRVHSRFLVIQRCYWGEGNPSSLQASLNSGALLLKVIAQSKGANCVRMCASMCKYVDTYVALGGQFLGVSGSWELNPAWQALQWQCLYYGAC